MGVAQAIGLSHWPWALQVWVEVPTHFFSPGLQTPVQLPFEQRKGQALPLDHCPWALQVCGVFPEHCWAPGEQAPVQAPFEQTNGQI